MCNFCWFHSGYIAKLCWINTSFLFLECSKRYPCISHIHENISLHAVKKLAPSFSCLRSFAKFVAKIFNHRHDQCQGLFWGCFHVRDVLGMFWGRCGDVPKTSPEHPQSIPQGFLGAAICMISRTRTRVIKVVKHATTVPPPRAIHLFTKGITPCTRKQY